MPGISCNRADVHNCFESTVRICSFVMSLLFGLTMVGLGKLLIQITCNLSLCYCVIPLILAITAIIVISKNDLHSKDDSNDDHDYLHNLWHNLWSQLMIAATVTSLPYSLFGTIALLLLVKKRRYIMCTI